MPSIFVMIKIKCLIAVYVGLMLLSYPGCMGYWQTKYNSNIWDDRAACVVFTIVPFGAILMPFMTGFYNRGFKL